MNVTGQMHVTFLHTSDIHSRLFPYDFQIGLNDSQLGLGPEGAVARIGGAAKVSHILGRERARSERVLHINGGDCFQGAPVFNFFSGEAEMRAMSEMGTDVMVIANHEFDRGALNVGEQIEKWATFPVLAANYKFDDLNTPGNPGLARVLVPWTSFNLGGLKVGVIGLGNLSTLSSIYEQPNNLGILPLNTQEVTQFYVDLIRPLVDLVVVVTHIGLEYDEKMIANTSGIDVVLGGHNHIVLQPPKAIDDCQPTDASGQHYINLVSGDAQSDTADTKYVQRKCNPRKVLLAHSGAFAKFVGRLDLIVSDQASDNGPEYDPINRFEVVQSDYKLIPVTEDTPEDPHVRETLVQYQAGLDALVDLDLLVGYSPGGVKRSATGGGDSALGNMVASSIWQRQGVQTDFALTNTTGVRSDMVPGPVTIEEMYNIFPFDNSIAKMQLSGVEVQDMFDFAARRSTSRGCVSQVQIAGARVAFNCAGCTNRPDLNIPCQTDNDCTAGGACDLATHLCKVPCASHVYIGRDEKTKCKSDVDCKKNPQDANEPLPLAACDSHAIDADGFGRCYFPIDPIASYELGTSNYLATGGSGFTVLKRNTSSFDTGVQQRDALIDFVRQGRPCGFDKANTTSDGLKACSIDSDCGDVVKFACACASTAVSKPDGTCDSSASCEGAGRCIYRDCRNSVAEFHRRTCLAARTDAARASCEADINPCQLGGEECKFLSCVDEKVGNFTDNRVTLEGK